MLLLACIASSEHDLTAHKAMILKQRLSVEYTHVTHRFKAKRGTHPYLCSVIYLQLLEDRMICNSDARRSLLTIRCTDQLWAYPHFRAPAQQFAALSKRSSTRTSCLTQIAPDSHQESCGLDSTPEAAGPESRSGCWRDST